MASGDETEEYKPGDRSYCKTCERYDGGDCPILAKLVRSHGEEVSTQGCSDHIEKKSDDKKPSSSEKKSDSSTKAGNK